ncbi:complex I NDUFA9 subunit family protein [Noviherbaspirillum autotrophicum]|uniref:complex I NDUFA9 subunit family protein n=1 Tax=Noviherbaspirillum autotrophicum TaxID=709839 RepID=UPI0006942DBC|nr:complex I NDUFA9 subunit family protein [Noviherbaspirillum autotrophicum]
MAFHSVLVIGGSGFIGSHIIAKLALTDWRAIVPTRHFDHAKDLLLVPSMDDVIEADVHDEATLDRLVPGNTAVINLVGILHDPTARSGEAYGREFARAHVDLPRKIVAACARHGVQHYLHMSALGADKNAPSMYLRSKADGEEAALSNPAVGVTIFRPSVVFGERDHFLNLFASLAKRFPVLPVAAADAKFQPVYVEDVAQAFVHALNEKTTIGKIYELAGPTVYTLRELVKLAGAFSGHPRPVFGLPPVLARLEAALLEHMSAQPLMSRDNLDSMKVDNVATTSMKNTLGIEPTALEEVAPAYLHGDRPHEHVATMHVRAPR